MWDVFSCHSPIKSLSVGRPGDYRPKKTDSHHGHWHLRAASLRAACLRYPLLRQLSGEERPEPGSAVVLLHSCLIDCIELQGMFDAFENFISTLPHISASLQSYAGNLLRMLFGLHLEYLLKVLTILWDRKKKQLSSQMNWKQMIHNLF